MSKSKESPISLVLAERIFGVVMALIGLILTYNTLTSLDVAGTTAGFSIIAGITMMAVGLILLLAQTKTAAEEE